MNDLLILGTGVHCAETAEIVARINAVKPAWNILGYIVPDNDTAAKVKTVNGHPVLGTPADVKKYPDAELALFNEEWPASVELPEDRLATIIDPSAFVSRTAALGPGCTFYPGCYIGLNARVGKRVCSLARSVINHDCVVGDRTVICSGAMLAGHVTVEPECYLGQGSTVRQFLTIGAKSFIGMGAVVVKDVAPGSVMAGNPARKLRDTERK